MINTINGYLSVLPNLQIIKNPPDNCTLDIKFSQPYGGMYEDLYIVVTFNDVKAFHLPQYWDGPFSLSDGGADAAKNLQPPLYFSMENFLAEKRKCFCILIDNIETGFYIDALSCTFMTSPRVWKGAAIPCH